MTTAFRNVYPGQRVITSAGTTRIVAFVDPAGNAYVYGPTGLEQAFVVCDAWGGEASLDANIPLNVSNEPSHRAAPRRATYGRSLRTAA